MWRESKNTDMQSNQMKFASAEHAIKVFVECQTTMNSAQGYDYREAQCSDTTGQTFGIDEYLTLKSVLQEAARDMPYELWVMMVEHVVGDRSVRSMEVELPGARKKMAVARRMVENVLRKRNMLLVRLSEGTA